MPFLAIDVGNTRLKWALYSAPAPGAGLIEHGAVFLETIDDLAERAWQQLPAPSSMLGSIVAGEGIRRRPRRSSRSGTSSRAGSCLPRRRAA
jgi:type III pantothenate kinase